MHACDWKEHAAPPCAQYNGLQLCGFQQAFDSSSEISMQLVHMQTVLAAHFICEV